MSANLYYFFSRLSYVKVTSYECKWPTFWARIHRNLGDVFAVMNGQWQRIEPLNREMHLMNPVACSATRLQEQISASINQSAELVRREKRIEYTGCFTTLGYNCRRWFSRSLWWKSSYKHVSDFGRLRSYDRLKLRIEGKDYWQQTEQNNKPA